MDDLVLHQRLEKLERINAGLQRGIDEILAMMQGCHERYKTRHDVCITCGKRDALRGDGHQPCRPMEVE